MKVFDKKNKQLTWLNRNYFYLATLTFVFINFMFFTCSPSLQDMFSPRYQTLNGLIVGILNAFTHYGWEHLLLNMLCFTVVSLYLERKFGSIKYFFLVSVSIVFSSAFFDMITGKYVWGGFSVTNYTIYGIFLCIYIYSIIKNKKDKTNIIWGGITIPLIYLAMCYNEVGGFPFKWYPVDLIQNSGHYSGIVAGLIISIVIILSDLIISYEYEKKEFSESDNLPKWKRITTLSIAGFMAIMIALFSVLASTNTTCKVRIKSDIKEFNITANLKTNRSSDYILEPQKILDVLQQNKNLSKYNNYAFNLSISTPPYNNYSLPAWYYRQGQYDIIPLAPITLFLTSEKYHSIKIEKSECFKDDVSPVDYFISSISYSNKTMPFFIYNNTIYTQKTSLDLFWISEENQHVYLEIRTTNTKPGYYYSNMVTKVNGEIINPNSPNLILANITEDLVITIEKKA